MRLQNPIRHEQSAAGTKPSMLRVDVNARGRGLCMR